uniref:Uncharacterized protein MANES_05G110600 n=1 Tax=Rhizophora mucronata TaxID=61149 RepID=A0A2P2LME6_RHIMU
MGGSRLLFSAISVIVVLATLKEARSHGVHPFSRIAIHKATFALTDLAHVKASPSILGLAVSLLLVPPLASHSFRESYFRHRRTSGD